MIWWVVELAILPLACSLLDIIIAGDNTVTEKQILRQTLSVPPSPHSPLKDLDSLGRVGEAAEVSAVAPPGVAPGGAHVQLEPGVVLPVQDHVDQGAHTRGWPGAADDHGVLVSRHHEPGEAAGLGCLELHLLLGQADQRATGGAGGQGCVGRGHADQTEVT